ncbi:MAG: hypothetical protein WDN29_05095 [Methylovirgula sp.]
MSDNDDALPEETTRQTLPSRVTRQPRRGLLTMLLTTKLDKSTRRIRLIAIGFALVYCIIGGKLIYFAMHPELRQVHETASDTVAAARPDILDRNGAVLATDIKVTSVFAEPRRIIDRDEAVDQLSNVPDGMTVDNIRARPPFLGRLRTLMEDALVLLDELPKPKAKPCPGPRLRVEARLLGDLFVCRNGFVSGKGAETDARYRAACRSACTWLAYILLPEFAAILRLEDSATLSRSAGREPRLTALSNSSNLGHRNNAVANRAQMNAGALVENTDSNALKLPFAHRDETIPQDDTPPQSKSVKRNKAKSARGNLKSEVSESKAAAVDEIPAAGAPRAAEMSAANGAVNSVASPRRKASRLATRPRALLHT